MKQRKKVKNFLLTYQSQFTKKARKIVAGKQYFVSIIFYGNDGIDVES